MKSILLNFNKKKLKIQVLLINYGKALTFYLLSKQLVVINKKQLEFHGRLKECIVIFNGSEICLLKCIQDMLYHPFQTLQKIYIKWMDIKENLKAFYTIAIDVLNLETPSIFRSFFHMLNSLRTLKKQVKILQNLKTYLIF